MAMVGGLFARKNTCARTLAEHVGGGRYMKEGIYARHVYLCSEIHEGGHICETCMYLVSMNGCCHT